MNDKLNPDLEEKSLQTMRKVLLSVGGICFLVGLVFQWPIVGKTYLQFIEGEGYVSIILGLIMIVLGFSIRLLAGETEDPP